LGSGERHPRAASYTRRSAFRLTYNSPEYLAKQHGQPPDLVQSVAVVEALAARAEDSSGVRHMEKVAEVIPGYTYGTADIATSPISMRELNDLKTTVGFTEEDQRYLQLAGAVLADQTSQIVQHWRSGIIDGIPHLARHSRTLEGNPIPEYLSNSNLRFQQWILDTCLRTYDQVWINYQNEIALRHTSLKKNKTDGVQSTTHVPLRDIIAFIPVMNQTIKPYLSAKGNSAVDVEKMHQAWCKSLQLQLAIWTRPYTDAGQAPNQW
jgi:hypothetical protein